MPRHARISAPLLLLAPFQELLEQLLLLLLAVGGGARPRTRRQVGIGAGLRRGLDHQRLGRRKARPTRDGAGQVHVLPARLVGLFAQLFEALVMILNEARATPI